MVDGDGIILERLRDTYGRDWTFGRTYRDGRPHWWMATRRRTLSLGEMERGLCPSLIYDTAWLMRAALEAQTALEVRMAAADAETASTAAAWNPAYL